MPKPRSGKRPRHEERQCRSPYGSKIPASPPRRSAPPLSLSEMSCGAKATNRSFAHIGRKLLPRPALENQRVHADDSVLGDLRDADGLGLTMTYAQLVRETFDPAWWDAPAWTTCGEDTERTALSRVDNQDGVECFDLMEANFSLFWGLAIQAYERTLLSGQTGFECLRSRSPGDRLFGNPDRVRTARPASFRDRRQMHRMSSRSGPHVGLGAADRDRWGNPPRGHGPVRALGSRLARRGVLQHRRSAPGRQRPGAAGPSAVTPGRSAAFVRRPVCGRDCGPRFRSRRP